MDSEAKAEFAAKDFTMGQLNALVKKIGGPDAVDGLMRGELKVIPNWKVWMRVPLGVCSTGWAYIEQIRRVRKMDMVEYAYNVLERKDFPCSLSLKYAHLVLTTPWELGFTKEPSILELYKRAEQWGLKLCRLEVAPALRLKYHSLSGEVLHIATPVLFRNEEQGEGDAADPFIFTVQYVGGPQTLGASPVPSRCRVDLGSMFIFEVIV